MSNPRPEPSELARIGAVVDGTVVAVFRWGIILDIGLSRVGLIDALYVDDGDRYAVGDTVKVILDDYDEQKDKFITRPPSQIPLADRLRARDSDI